MENFRDYIKAFLVLSVFIISCSESTKVSKPPVEDLKVNYCEQYVERFVHIAKVVVSQHQEVTLVDLDTLQYSTLKEKYKNECGVYTSEVNLRATDSIKKIDEYIAEKTAKKEREEALSRNKKTVTDLLSSLDETDIPNLLKGIMELQSWEDSDALEDDVKDTIKRRVEYLSKKYKKQLVAELAWEVYKEQCGEPPSRSAWDNSISVVREFVKTVANDPSSIEFIGCSVPFLEKKNCYRTVCVFRGKNVFGGTVINSKTFYITNTKILKVM
jgi:hypothetical protein